MLLTMILNTTQVLIAIPGIMIICPFSSSHFAILIFPIHELRIVEAIQGVFEVEVFLVTRNTIHYS
jgi:hypothetical protein